MKIRVNNYDIDLKAFVIIMLFPILLITFSMGVTFAWFELSKSTPGISISTGDLKYNIALFDSSTNKSYDENCQIDVPILTEDYASNVNAFYIVIARDNNSIDLDYKIDFKLNDDLEITDEIGSFKYNISEIDIYESDNETLVGNVKKSFNDYCNDLKSIRESDLNEVTDLINTINLSDDPDELEKQDYKTNNSKDNFSGTPLSMINDRYDTGSISIHNDKYNNYAAFYRVTIWQVKNTNVIENTKQKVSLNGTIYATQLGAMTDKGKSGITYTVGSEDELNNVLDIYRAGDIIHITNGFDYHGSLIFNKPINLYVDSGRLKIAGGNLIFSSNAKDSFNINTRSGGQIIVTKTGHIGGRLEINTPYSNFNIIGANRYTAGNGDIYLADNATIVAKKSENYSTDKTPYYFVGNEGISIGASIYKISDGVQEIPTTQVSLNTLILSGNSSVDVLKETIIGTLTTTEQVSYIDIINRGTINNLSLQNTSLVIDKEYPSIYVDSYSEIVNTIFLPEWSRLYHHFEHAGNTQIIQRLTSNELSVLGAGDGFTDNDIDKEKIEEIPFVRAYSYINDVYTEIVANDSGNVDPNYDENEPLYLEINYKDEDDNVIYLKNILQEKLMERIGTTSINYDSIYQIRITGYGDKVLSTTNPNNDYDTLKSLNGLVNLDLSGIGSQDNFVPNNAFSGSTGNIRNLSKINLPKNIKSVGINAFTNTEVHEISLPLSYDNSRSASLAAVFDNLNYIHILNNEKLINGTLDFNNKYYFVEESMLNKYRTKYTSNNQNIVVESSVEDSGNYYVRALSNGTYQITLYKFIKENGSKNVLPRETIQGTGIIGDVKIKGKKYSVSSIGDYAFYNAFSKSFMSDTGTADVATNSELITIQIGEDISSIGIKALSCSSSSEGNYSVLGRLDFSQCSSIDFNQSIQYHTKLDDIKMPRGGSLTGTVFTGLNSLEKLDLNGITTIYGVSTFTNLGSLKELYARKLTKIDRGSGAATTAIISSCPNLSYINFESLTYCNARIGTSLNISHVILGPVSGFKDVALFNKCRFLKFILISDYGFNAETFDTFNIGTYYSENGYVTKIIAPEEYYNLLSGVSNITFYDCNYSDLYFSGETYDYKYTYQTTTLDISVPRYILCSNDDYTALIYDNSIEYKEVNKDDKYHVVDISYDDCRHIYDDSDTSTLYVLNINSIRGPAFFDVKFTGVGLTFEESSDPSKGITTIGRRALYGNTTLKDILFIDSIKTIEDEAFRGCTGLTDVNLEEVTTLKDNTFYGCTSLLNARGDNVTVCGNNTFYNCSVMQQIYLPNLRRSGSNLWYASTGGGYGSLRRVVIGPVVATYGSGSILNINHLYSTLGTYLMPKIVVNFMDDSEFDVTNLDAFINQKNDDYRLALGDSNKQFTYICGEKAKEYCTKEGYTHMFLGESNVAFIYDCVDVNSIDTVGSYKAKGIAFVGDYIAYKNDRGTATLICNINPYQSIAIDEEDEEGNVTTVKIPSKVLLNNEELTVDTIGQRCFQNSGSSVIPVSSGKIVLPDNITRIESYAFASQTSITYIEGNKVLYIGDRAFNEATGLISVVFENCAETGIYPLTGNTALVEIIMPRLLECKKGLYDGPQLSWYVDTSLKRVLVGPVHIDGDGSLIKLLAHGGASSSTAVIVNLSDDVWDYYYEHEGDNLTKALLSGNTSNGGEYLNSRPYYIYVCGEKAKESGIKDFYVASTRITKAYIYDCDNFYDITKVGDYSKSNVYIGDYLSYKIKDSDNAVIFNCINSYQNISIDGDASYKVPTSVVINGETLNVNTIGEYCYPGRYLNFTNVVLDLSHIEYVRDRAFYYCTGLIEVNLDNAISIGDYAFAECTSLINVSIPKITSLGNYVFYGCTSLESLDIGLVTSVGNYTFYNCKNLEGLETRYLKTIGNYAFYNNTKLDGALDLKSAVTIGTYAFTGESGALAPQITKVLFGSDISSIGNNAFDKDINLYSIVIGNEKTMITVGTNVFASAPITEVYVPVRVYNTYVNNKWNKYAASKFIPSGYTYEENGLTYYYNEYIVNEEVVGWKIDLISGTMIDKQILVIPNEITRIIDEETGEYVTYDVVYYQGYALSGIVNPQYTSIQLPSNMIRFDTNEMQYYSNTLTTYVIENGTNFKVVNGILYSNDGSTLYSCPCGYVPNYNEEGLYYLDISADNNLTVINNSFYGCINFDEIYLSSRKGKVVLKGSPFTNCNPDLTVYI